MPLFAGAARALPPSRYLLINAVSAPMREPVNGRMLMSADWSHGGDEALWQVNAAYFLDTL
ncbi:hypothetical protein BSG18_14390 [Pseudomonas ogarae]|nr:hypothetical protein BSF43_26510 [Pseudomonas ogarae]PBJ24472.1 hypothetical protein BSG18_14390 [Pseudomonas ogarae]